MSQMHIDAVLRDNCYTQNKITMSPKNSLHRFHIPVMGIGFTIDTPAKVAHYGLSSVISLVDDILVEKMRKFYSEKFELPFEKISSRVDDFRAKRITAYLNVMEDVAKIKLEKLKDSIIEQGAEFEKYMQILPDSSDIKKRIQNFIHQNSPKAEVKAWLNENLPLGSIDVNIMTKLDKQAVRAGEALPDKYRDAHSALRGFAESDPHGAMVFSAGMNPRLYAYCEQFNDFYPDANGYIKKRIILKVSDYRSALIQGKFFAKKGLWVSEYRIESGLNCGGHAFASDGLLMGPILEDFKKNREGLLETTFEMYKAALQTKGRECPENAPEMRIAAQGGVGNHNEHELLLNEYQLDSVGWGTPFLLAPDVTVVDSKTLAQLEKAKEQDLYLSNISPLGVPFNSLRGNSKDQEKQMWIDQGTPGSPCPKRFAALNTEFTEREICTASRQYQKTKLDELKEKNLNPFAFQKEEAKILEKSCICVGLGTPALLVNGIEHKAEGPGVSVCPGPNLAYFSHRTSLPEMAQHIYGKTNIIERTDRPNLFLKELTLYRDFFLKQVNNTINELSDKELKHLLKFKKNINSGIDYYQGNLDNIVDALQENKNTLSTALEAVRDQVNSVKLDRELKLATA